MRVLLCTAVLATMATSALADPMASAYGNTVVITYPNGMEAKLHIDAGGAYTGSSPQGATKGAWTIADGQTCFAQTEPAPPAGTPASCAPTVDKHVGDVWDGVGQGGAPVKITIVAGR